jgi:hypothetical protein
MYLSRRAGAADPRWYFGVYCRQCRAPIVFGVDHTAGETAFTPVEKLLLTCSDTACRHQVDYSKATVSLFQKTANAGYEERPAAAGMRLSK